MVFIAETQRTLSFFEISVHCDRTSVASVSAVKNRFWTIGSNEKAMD